MTISINQLKKIFPALKLIDKTPRGMAKVCKTLSVTADGLEGLCFSARDFNKSLQIFVKDINYSNFSQISVKFDKFCKVMSSVKDLPSFDKAENGEILLEFKGGRKISLANAQLNQMEFAPLECIPDTERQSWDAKRLLEGLSYCEPVVSTDETRFHLNTILFSSDGYFVATDGHRLHRYEYGDCMVNQKQESYLVSREAVKIVQSAIKTCGGASAIVTSIKTQDTIFFEISGNGLVFKFTSILVDSKFPSYKAIIPRTWNTKCSVPVNTSNAAFSLLEKLSDTYNYVSEFSINLGAMRIKGDGVEESIETSMFEGDTIDFGKVGANSKYLKQATANLPGDTVTIKFGAGLDPIVLEQGKFMAVVMPVRV